MADVSRETKLDGHLTDADMAGMTDNELNRITMAYSSRGPLSWLRLMVDEEVERRRKAERDRADGRL